MNFPDRKKKKKAFQAEKASIRERKICAKKMVKY